MITLTIDQHNMIQSVGGEWNHAAQEGGALDILSTEKVIGKNIEIYLGSDTTQMYYDALYKLCRLKKETITRDYRCDSPTHERYMKITLIPLENSAIEMQHVTIKEIPFKHAVHIEDMKDSSIKNIAYTKRCSICNRLKYPNSEVWSFPEELNDKKPLHIKVIHTVCPDCKNKNWLKGF